ncbi:MAG: M28 family peptidase [Acidobacteria bacterium]|nr:M28 family peptidase [Acidobacteriota bacterium]
MRRRQVVVAVWVGAATALAFAVAGREKGPIPEETVLAAEKLREQAQRGGRADEWVRRLTDEVGPRLTGSAGDQLAGPWSASLMKSLGFTNVRLEPVRARSWMRLKESAEVIAPSRQPLVLTALGGSVSTPEGGIEAPVVAVPSLAALGELVANDPEYCRGKIVFFNQRMTRGREEMSGYGTSVPVRLHGAARAARAGAAAVLIRSIGTSNNRYAHTGQLRYENEASKIPAAALSNPDADLLERLVAGSHPVRVRLEIQTRSLEEVETANVVGEIPGRGAPEEIVVLSGHIDSWDLGTGAIDDGAGCALAIESARLIGEMPRKPLRTLRVVLFANEENGLAGGTEYAKRHASEIARHVAAIEADSGTGRPVGIGWNGGASGRPIMRALSELLVPLSAQKTFEGGYGGADLSPLGPTDLPLFGLRQDISTYFDFHHTANDTFDKIEPVALRKATAALAVWAYVMADLPAPFPRGRLEKKQGAK